MVADQIGFENPPINQVLSVVNDRHEDTGGLLLGQIARLSQHYGPNSRGRRLHRGVGGWAGIIPEQNGTVIKEIPLRNRFVRPHCLVDQAFHSSS